MAYTAAATGLTPKQWDDEFFTEYLGNNPAKPYMGTDETSIIQIKEDLSKKKGDTIAYALFNKFTGNPNDGSTKLVGNEEQGKSRSFALTVGLRRNAFVTKEFEEQKSAIDLRKAGKAQMKEWAIDQDVARIATNMLAVDGVPYATASAAQRNTWLVNNSDRVLFGATKSNNTGVMSTSLTNVDNVADKLTASALSLMKRIALSADPKLRPIRVSEMNKRYFVVFAHPLCFRDLKSDPVIIQAQREVQLTNQNNKLFQGGDIEWDGMIIHEYDDYPTLTGAGASGINVGPVHLLGAQAMGLAIARRWNTVDLAETDYENEQGFGIRCIDGLQKIRFGTGANDTDNPKDYGVVSGFFAAVPDA